MHENIQVSIVFTHRNSCVGFLIMCVFMIIIFIQPDYIIFIKDWEGSGGGI